MLFLTKTKVIFGFGGFIDAATTTTSRPIVAIKRAGDPIVGLYNTTADGSMAIDGSLHIKYLNYGSNGSLGITMSQPGENTGFYVTPSIRNGSAACGPLFATANDRSALDSLTVTLEGTNEIILNASSNWTLLYNDPTGIDPLIVPNRSVYGVIQLFSNTIAFRSYRLLVTSQRGDQDFTQYAESQIMSSY